MIANVQTINKVIEMFEHPDTMSKLICKIEPNSIIPADFTHLRRDFKIENKVQTMAFVWYKDKQGWVRTIDIEKVCNRGMSNIVVGGDKEKQLAILKAELEFLDKHKQIIYNNEKGD